MTYYQNGEFQIRGTCESGRRTGECTWYYETGGANSTVTCVGDKKEGEQIFFSEPGKEVKKEIYEDGELVSEEML